MHTYLFYKEWTAVHIEKVEVKKGNTYGERYILYYTSLFLLFDLKYNNILYITAICTSLGWFLPFYILNENQVEKCCIPCKSLKNKIKFFPSIDLMHLTLRLTFWVIHYIRTKHFFFIMWTDLSSIKGRRILPRIQKYTTLIKIAPEKIYQRKEML